MTVIVQLAQFDLNLIFTSTCIKNLDLHVFQIPHDVKFI